MQHHQQMLEQLGLPLQREEHRQVEPQPEEIWED
jgi:hypothetical protein